MHIRRSPSGDGPTIYRPNESARHAARSAASARRTRTRFDSPAAAGFAVAHARQPAAWPDPDRHGLDRRHRELRLGRVVGAQPGRQAGGKGLEPLVVQAPTTPTRGSSPRMPAAWCRPTRTRKSTTASRRARCRPSPRSCCPARPSPSCRRAACRRRRRPSLPSRKPPRPRRRCSRDAAATARRPTPPPAGATTPRPLHAGHHRRQARDHGDRSRASPA